MSGSSSSGSSYLPTPPMVVAGQQTTTQAIESGNGQLQALLNIIHGGYRYNTSTPTRKRGFGKNRRYIPGKKSRRRRTMRRFRGRSRHRRQRSRHCRRVGGDGQVALNIPPVSYNNTAVPGPAEITKSLLQTSMQSNANGALDAVGSGSGSGK